MSVRGNYSDTNRLAQFSAVSENWAVYRWCTGRESLTKLDVPLITFTCERWQQRVVAQIQILL